MDGLILVAYALRLALGAAMRQVNLAQAGLINAPSMRQATHFQLESALAKPQADDNPHLHKEDGNHSQNQ